MVGQHSVEISEDEAALYDRQIRLWGLDAQKRLRGSRILLIGMRGLAAEVCKNLVLAGVKSITLLDHGVITEEDCCSQFLAPHDQIGKNRAEASLCRSQELNPMVEVIADTENVADKPDSFFNNFTVICVTGCSRAQMVHLNCICREKDIKFFSGDVFGFFGYMFSDLQEHDYLEELKQCSAPSTETEQPEAKRVKLDDTKLVKRTMIFAPLQDALDVDWGSELYSKRLKRMDPSYFILQVLLQFRTVHGRDPAPKSRREDIAELLKLRDEVLEKLVIPKEKVEDRAFTNAFAQLSPVCAIVGGVLAQEIIKAVSQKDAPHNNFFFYNPLDGSGIVECLGL